MKILNAVFTCFIFLYAAVLIYVGIRYEPHSPYWLAFELFFWFVVLSAHFYRAIKSKETGKWGGFFSVIVWSLLCGYYSYRAIAKYDDYLCSDKFGPEFNARRQSLGVPQIPADWHEAYTSNHSAHWEQVDSTTGHHDKHIYIDSTCAIEFEDDQYYLKTINGKSCGMWVQTRYARGKAKDSIFFRYSNGDSSRVVTRQQADSIFSAAKIAKDY